MNTKKLPGKTAKELLEEIKYLQKNSPLDINALEIICKNFELLNQLNELRFNEIKKELVVQNIAKSYNDTSHLRIIENISFTLLLSRM
jgi:hypothetical protein